MELELGSEFAFHSIFACPVSREQSSAENPPCCCRAAMCCVNRAWPGSRRHACGPSSALTVPWRLVLTPFANSPSRMCSDDKMRMRSYCNNPSRGSTTLTEVAPSGRSDDGQIACHTIIQTFLTSHPCSVVVSGWQSATCGAPYPPMSVCVRAQLCCVCTLLFVKSSGQLAIVWIAVKSRSPMSDRVALP